jgi:hypothetical protein
MYIFSIYHPQTCFGVLQLGYKGKGLKDSYKDDLGIYKMIINKNLPCRPLGKRHILSLILFMSSINLLLNCRKNKIGENWENFAIFWGTSLVEGHHSSLQFSANFVTNDTNSCLGWSWKLKSTYHSVWLSSSFTTKQLKNLQTCMKMLWKGRIGCIYRNMTTIPFRASA